MSWLDWFRTKKKRDQEILDELNAKGKVSRQLPFDGPIDWDAEVEMMRQEQLRCQPVSIEPEPFIPLNHRITSMKVSEQQVLMLIEVAADAARQMSEIAGYSDDDVIELLNEIRENTNTTPVELSSQPVKL